MKRIHIVGRKNHGKTTLIVELLKEYGRRGIPVGSIKHSAHQHDLDPPGKDSYRHREAGANPAAIISRNLVGVFLPREEATDPYDAIASLFTACELVLVEGGIDASAPKVEVWRACHAQECLAASRHDILAVISDESPAVAVPIWPRSEVGALAEKLLHLAGP